MSFWIAASALIALTTLAAAWPLLRAQASQAGGVDDGAIYRAQLLEIETDTRRGILPAGEAASARAEIARRLMRAESAPRSQARARSGRAVGPALAILLFVPAGGLLLYASTGAAGLADAPLAARVDAGADIATMIAAAEARLAENPGDARGHDVLAPIYLRIGDPEKAASAYTAAIGGLGSTFERQSGLGEALVQASGGRVTPAAEDAFRAANAFDADAVEPRFYLALARSQAGDNANAATAWAQLIADAPADAPWLAVARQAETQARSAGRGPDVAAVAAAAELSTEDRDAMIGGMVAGLEARLASDPADVEGWMRLLRSYRVLGDDARLVEASGKAREVFAAGSEERDRLEAFIGELNAARETRP